MSPDAPAPTGVRSAAALNTAIRDLWQRGGGQLGTAELRAEYEQLVVAWAAAVQAERHTAEAA